MESDLLGIILLGGLLPGLIVGVGLLMLHGLLGGEQDDGDTHSARRLRWGAPLLFFLGFVAILGAAKPIGPEFWSSNVADRRLALGVLALACALPASLIMSRALSGLVGGIAGVIGGAIAAWMITSVYHPHIQNAGDIVLWCASAGLACASGAAIQGLFPIGRGWVAPTQAAMVVMGTLGLMYWSSQAPTAPQLGGVKAMLIAAGLASAILGGVRLSGGGWTYIGVMLAGYLTLARVSGDTTPPALSMALIPGGIATGALGRWLGGRVRVPLLGAVVALALTAIPVGAGALIAWRDYNEAHSEDGWSDTEEDDEGGVYYYTDDE